MNQIATFPSQTVGTGYYVNATPWTIGTITTVPNNNVIYNFGGNKVSSFETAFKVVGIMIDKGYVKDLSASDMIKLVQDIQKELKDA